MNTRKNAIVKSITLVTAIAAMGTTLSACGSGSSAADSATP